MEKMITLTHFEHTRFLRSLSHSPLISLHVAQSKSHFVSYTVTRVPSMGIFDSLGWKDSLLVNICYGEQVKQKNISNNKTFFACDKIHSLAKDGRKYGIQECTIAWARRDAQTTKNDFWRAPNIDCGFV